MDSRPVKMAKLQSLRSRLPYVSQTALHALLEIAKSEELPSVSSRRVVREARDCLTSQKTSHGLMHKQLHIGGCDLEYQNPFAMLAHMSAESTHLSSLMRRAFAERPCSSTQPWTLVVYLDEILPGNQLAHKNERKMWGVYWSILEWGPAVLSDEAYSTEFHVRVFSVDAHCMFHSLVNMFHILVNACLCWTCACVTF